MGNVKASQDRVFLSAFNDNNDYYITRNILGGSIVMDLNNSDTAYQNAKKMAVDLTNKMNLSSTLGAHI